ncbi:hypothetical protein PHMEG_00017103 [Phytophthora megakarya]|uniref:Chromo domain-containing protein n=1 Tax=Phytophthora megakarya TaxID=4795 RepID=A0A225VZ76_9STRA|nr:hypothetical protein PHMEG_00017103 [Phytophthora megakarya]
MTTSLKRGVGKQTEALAWRREINRQHQIALEMAKEYQATEKARRAQIHNDKLSRKEHATVPGDPNEHSTDDHKSVQSLWLYMERVKPGLVNKLAHRWHGPFRVKRKVEEFAYELELPDKSGYRFYPVVHVSRLKAVNEYCDRPKTRLAQDVTEIFTWERPDHVAGEFEVKAILNDRTPMSTSTDKPVREFEVKWVGYDETTWEPASNLSCGGLLYDYLRKKKSEHRLQMVQVTDEN